MTNKQNNGDCQLCAYLSELESTLPQEKKAFLFERKLFPTLPTVIRTPKLDVRKTYHFINNSCRVDVLNFMASKKTYRYWGLAILAAIFRPELSALTLQLECQSSQIKSILLRYPGTTSRAVLTYLTAPHSFEYHPEEIAEHPWMGRCIPENGWPDFLLTYSGSDLHNHWEDRDVIEGFGNDDASVMLADLLLNLGRDKNKQLMVRLETIFAPAYRGVSRLSCEVQLHLPGSESWPGYAD